MLALLAQMVLQKNLLLYLDHVLNAYLLFLEDFHFFCLFCPLSHPEISASQRPNRPAKASQNLGAVEGALPIPEGGFNGKNSLSSEKTNDQCLNCFVFQFRVYQDLRV